MIHDYIQRIKGERLPIEVLHKEEDREGDLHISGKDILEDRVLEDGGWENRSLWNVYMVNT
jgi:hypothetical protein